MTTDRTEAHARLDANLGPLPEEVRERHLDFILDIAPSFWGDDHISQALRSAVTLGVLTALGEQTELAVHIQRAVLRSGLSREEVGELLRHCSAYAGVPRANAALRTATEAFARLDVLESQPLPPDLLRRRS